MIQQLTAGDGATAVRISPDGTLALVANRIAGAVSVFAIKEKRLEAAATLDLGNSKAGPNGIAFAVDGKTALLTRNGYSMVSVLHLDGTKITVDPRSLTTGVRLYTIDIGADG